MGFKNLIIGMGLIMLFAFLIIGFIVQTGNEYGKDVSELEDEGIDVTAINRTLQNFESNSTAWGHSFESQNIFSSLVGIIVTGFFSITTTIWAFIWSPITLLNQILVNVLHIPNIIVGIINFALVILIIFGIWKLIKIGE